MVVFPATRCLLALCAGLALSASPTKAGAELPTVPRDFKVEVIASSKPGGDSWVCMTMGPKGRIILSPEGHPGYLTELTLTSDGKLAGEKKIDRPVGSAMGLAFAFDSLYVNGDGPKGYGLYRLRYDTTNDTYGWPQLIAQFGGAPYDQHGAHAVVPGPDNRLYVVCGNFVTPPQVSPDSPLQQCSIDQILPVDDNANGFGIGLHPPGGFVLRIGPDGQNPELVCGGMRNVYDIAFNANGDFFGLDNDQDIDCGLPWYRPNRLLHLVSGGDYGHREGTAPLPDYYADTLPAVAYTGLGAPSGIQFGNRGNFPGKYRTALYALDWGSGRILAIHLSPKGASYSATIETFLEGKGIDATDIEFARDGPMYFITGGNKTQSDLYRVSYVGPPAPQENEDSTTNKSIRTTRRMLESFHGRVDPHAIDAAWPFLSSDDRFIRYAARLAIESQPVSQWQERALSESNPIAALEALLALTRNADADQRDKILKKLDAFPLTSLAMEQQLEKLRVLQLCFIRFGFPPAGAPALTLAEVEAAYPATDPRLNAELCQLLVYLEAPDAVGKSLALLDAASSQEEQISYIFYLRHLKHGWTIAQRRHYFEWFKLPPGKRPGPSPALRQWFAQAGRAYSDGSSMAGYLANFRAEAIQSLSSGEHSALDSWLQTNEPTQEILPAPKPRSLIKIWTLEDFSLKLSELQTNHESITRGASIFREAGCIQCHHIGTEGGSVGPDLTSISTRYNARDILESILDPSKVIAEQYRNATILTKDGDEFTGRIVAETSAHLTLMTDPVQRSSIQIAATNIVKREFSRLSPMPQGLLNTFSADDVLALLAYLESGGRSN